MQVVSPLHRASRTQRMLSTVTDMHVHTHRYYRHCKERLVLHTYSFAHRPGSAHLACLPRYGQGPQDRNAHWQPGMISPWARHSGYSQLACLPGNRPGLQSLYCTDIEIRDCHTDIVPPLSSGASSLPDLACMRCLYVRLLMCATIRVFDCFCVRLLVHAAVCMRLLLYTAAFVCDYLCARQPVLCIVRKLLVQTNTYSACLI